MFFINAQTYRNTKCTIKINETDNFEFADLFKLLILFFFSGIFTLAWSGGRRRFVVRVSPTVLFSEEQNE